MKRKRKGVKSKILDSGPNTTEKKKKLNKKDSTTTTVTTNTTESKSITMKISGNLEQDVELN